MTLHRLLRFAGYFYLYSTPLTLAVLLWILFFLHAHADEYTWISLSTGDFLQAKLPTLLGWILSPTNPLAFVFAWFFQFPAVLLITLRLIGNTALGIWLLKKFR